MSHNVIQEWNDDAGPIRDKKFAGGEMFGPSIIHGVRVREGIHLSIPAESSAAIQTVAETER